MKRFEKVLRDGILILLGAMAYGFIGEAVKVYESRAAGNIGGEIFVIPLFALLVWFGWQLRGNCKK